MRNISDTSCRENRNIFYDQEIFFKNRAVFEIVWKNMIYEGKSLNNRNAILKCMEMYAQRKILFRDTKWLLSNMSYRGRDDQAV